MKRKIYLPKIKFLKGVKSSFLTDVIKEGVCIERGTVNDADAFLARIKGVIGEHP